MKYDFTSIMDRKGKDAIAYDLLGDGKGFAPDAPREGFDAIPMWVADMNFPTCPSITKAIIDRTNHPAFGYFRPSKQYYDAIISWQERNNKVSGLLPEHIGYENGVLGGLISALNCICSKGDNVLLHSPTYIGFTNSLKNNGYNMILSPLIKDENDVWRMDYADMEEKLKKGNIHAAIMCNPFNPCGRAWTKEELLKAMELFKKYDVYVISDEIWSDIMLYSNTHIPTQSVSEDAKMRTIALYSPSKTFSLAGLVGSYHIIYNKWLKSRVEKESSLSHYNEMNVLSMHGLIGAYSDEGQEWKKELCETLSQNVDYAYTFIKENFPDLSTFKPEATYMMFIDCTKWCEKNAKTIADVEKACWDVGVAVQDGRMFHGPCHIRMNLALPLSRVKEAFERLKEYVYLSP